MSFHIDEFLHNTKHAAQQQTGDYAPFAYGHIANYDAKTHRVRVVLVSVRNEDDVPSLSGWMTLGGMGGNGWGIQIAPKGGASVDNPTAGELVVVQRVDRGLGVQAVACMVWNQVNVPPFPELAPGEIGIKGAGGASILIDKNNNITLGGDNDLAITVQGTTQINSTGDMTINSSGACTLSATGNLTLSSMGQLAISAVAAAITNGVGIGQKLLTALAAAVYNTHTHTANGQPPTQQMTSTDETSVFTAQ